MGGAAGKSGGGRTGDAGSGGSAGKSTQAGAGGSAGSSTEVVGGSSSGATGGSSSGAAGESSTGAGSGGTTAIDPNCVEGTVRSCAASPLDKKGACALDTATCKKGEWVGCVDTKGDDTCDAGDDSNCNGKPNEGCTCESGETQPCGHAAVGLCKKGTSTCEDGVWGACQGSVDPAPRDCTSTDDADCDGSPDNTRDDTCQCASGSTQSCDTHPGLDGNGACKAGSQSCVVAADKTSSSWDDCSGAVGPSGADSCDAGNDNNCNGIRNENCPCVNGAVQPCGHAAVGICKPGTQTCQNQVWGDCSGNIEPKARDCTSSTDNDCDGQPDNTVDNVCKCASGSTRTCGTHLGYDGNGPCKAGTQACSVASNKTSSDWSTTCSGSIGPSNSDTCDSGNDNNCNGVTNEGCACINGSSVPCACGPATTCTNGMKGTCSQSKTTLYLDSDGDSYGDPNQSSQQCPGTAKYVTNKDDCDDNNNAFKPGVSICSSATQKENCPTNGGGQPTFTPCDQGCMNGSCRTDGTIGLPGYVSCTDVSHCLAADGCQMDDLSGGCGTSGSGSSVYIHCDGPNDCPGQYCMMYYTRGENDTKCYDAIPPDTDSYDLVCDPLASNICPAGTSCTKAGRYPLYLCQ